MKHETSLKRGEFLHWVFIIFSKSTLLTGADTWLKLPSLVTDLIRNGECGFSLSIILDMNQAILKCDKL